MHTRQETHRGRFTAYGVLFCGCALLANTIGCGGAPGAPSAAVPVLATPTPAVESVQAVIAQHVPSAKILGLFKKADNSYLVLTDVPTMNYGGPYQLVRLESGDWYIELPPNTNGVGTSFYKVAK